MNLGRAKQGAQEEVGTFSAGSVVWLLLPSQMAGGGDQSLTAELELQGMMSGRRIPMPKCRSDVEVCIYVCLEVRRTSSSVGEQGMRPWCLRAAVTSRHL